MTSRGGGQWSTLRLAWTRGEEQWRVLQIKEGIAWRFGKAGVRAGRAFAGGHRTHGARGLGRRVGLNKNVKCCSAQLCGSVFKRWNLPKFELWSILCKHKSCRVKMEIQVSCLEFAQNLKGFWNKLLWSSSFRKDKSISVWILSLVDFPNGFSLYFWITFNFWSKESL